MRSLVHTPAADLVRKIPAEDEGELNSAGRADERDAWGKKMPGLSRAASGE